MYSRQSVCDIRFISIDEQNFELVYVQEGFIIVGLCPGGFFPVGFPFYHKNKGCLP